MLGFIPANHCGVGRMAMKRDAVAASLKRTLRCISILPSFSDLPGVFRFNSCFLTEFIFVRVFKYNQLDEVKFLCH